MSAGAFAARLRPALGVLARATDAVTSHVVVSLAAIVALQIGLTVALFFSVEHNGWLTYQGGDQLWLVTTGWLLGQGILPYGLVAPLWPVVLMPLTWLTGASSLDLLPVTTVLQVGVLGPVATLAVYDIGARIAGRLGGLWCASAWVLAPFLATPLFVERYQERWTDQVLVQALGLTQLADYPSLVLVLVAAALVLRSLDSGALRESALAGAVAGAAIGTKPSNALFLIGAAAAFSLARCWRGGLLFALSLLPAVLTLAIWKERGVGSVPLFVMDDARLAVSHLAGSALPLADSYLDRLPLDLDDWNRNMSNLREFFWSARLAQWAPLAGAIAVARRSLPAAGLLLGWLLGYVVVKGASDVSSIENASFWRLVLPALPAYVILAAAIPMLVPTLGRRLTARLAPAPRRRPTRRLVVAVTAVLAIAPATTVLAASPMRNPEKAVEVNGILVPVAGDIVSLRVTRAGEAQRLEWDDATSRARTFYRVYRTASTGPDVVCKGTGADRCGLDMVLLGTTRTRSFVDGSPEPGVTYRVGVAANWVDDTDQGDVMLISPPVRAAR